MKIKDLSTVTSALKVLYVEDDMTLMEQNKEFFQQLFKTIDVATDGEEALAYYKQNRYDIVITDINIPKINGLSMIKLMQQQNSSQKFLITTVYSENELKPQLDELGINYFLTKPILTKSLLKKIEEVVYELEPSS